MSEGSLITLNNWEGPEPSPLSHLPAPLRLQKSPASVCKEALSDFKNFLKRKYLEVPRSLEATSKTKCQASMVGLP